MSRGITPDWAPGYAPRTVTPTELELLAARDHGAMARLYDHHVAMVAEFCAALCPDERVDEAVAAVFVNFLSRATEASDEAEPENLLRSAAREVAASRMEIEGSSPERCDAVCRVMPELLAARVNGELRGHSGAVADHLSRCSICRATAARLGQAEVMFPVGSAGGVTELRAEWLELAGERARAAGAAGIDPMAPAARRTADAGGAQAAPQQPVRAGDTDPGDGPQQQPGHGWSRRGGLVGVARRMARPQGPDQTPASDGPHGS